MGAASSPNLAQAQNCSRDQSEEALRTCTTAPAEGAGMDDRLGHPRPGCHGDSVVRSENILAPDFDPLRFARKKACLAALNGT